MYGACPQVQIHAATFKMNFFNTFKRRIDVFNNSTARKIESQLALEPGYFECLSSVHTNRVTEALAVEQSADSINSS